MANNPKIKEIVVISGKGGAGKTSITAGLATLLRDPVLIDCDVDASNFHLLLSPEITQTTEFMGGLLPAINPDLCTRCGLCRAHCSFHAIDEDFAISAIHCEGCGVCGHVCPAKAITFSTRVSGVWHVSETRLGPLFHARLEPGEGNSGKLAALLRKEAKAAAQKTGKDLILIDGPPGIGCPVISSLSQTDLAILVTEPTPSGVHDMKRALELARKLKVKTAILINKGDLNPKITAEVKAFAEHSHIPVIGEIGYTLDFTRAMAERKTIVEFDSVYHSIFGKIADRINQLISEKG